MSTERPTPLECLLALVHGLDAVAAQDARWREEEIAALRAEIAEARRYCPAAALEWRTWSRCGWREDAPVYRHRSRYVPGWSGLDGDVCAGVPAYLAARSLPAPPGVP